MSNSTRAETATASLDLAQPIVELTKAVMDIYSVSDHERQLADGVWAHVHDLPDRFPGRYTVQRVGDSMLIRTEFGREERVMLAGHLDTVPLPTVPGSRGTVPAVLEGDILYGRGATDMKGGVAVQLSLLQQIIAGELVPNRDITFVFYDHEEVSFDLSGFARLEAEHADLLGADFGVLLEPSDGVVEGGCNGTLRVIASFTGKAAHSARAWMGENAIHKGAALLTALAAYEAATHTVDGLDYRESLNAVRITGGTAGNVIPDALEVEINYRFAPNKSVEQAWAHVQEVFGGAVSDAGGSMELVDSFGGARPGLNHPAARAFVETIDGEPKPKYGWTDVARLSKLGIPAVNFGPGDALLAHSDDEHVSVHALRRCLEVFEAWLGK